MKRSWEDMPQIPVAWGEVFDKLTILEIKTEKISDPQRLKNVVKEKSAIEAVVGDMAKFPTELPTLVNELKAINLNLWDVEDAKRDCERKKQFDEAFIQLARKVYFGNDERALIKKRINILLESAIIEEKSYQTY